MGVFNGISKGILVLIVVIWVFLIFEFIEMNLTAIAMFVLIGLIISISIVAFEYWKNRKKKETLPIAISSVRFVTLWKKPIG